MRNTIKTLAALLIVLSAANAIAKTDSANAGIFCKVVAHNSEDSYKLIYKAAEKEDVKVTWEDSYGNIIYAQSHKSAESVIKQYDLSSLPKGTYTIDVVADDYAFTKEVTIGSTADFNFVMKRGEGRNVVMTGIQPQGKDVTLLIFDENQNQLYKEAITDTETVQKKFNFDKVDTNEVTFMLFHNGDVFKETTLAIKD